MERGGLSSGREGREGGRGERKEWSGRLVVG